MSELSDNETLRVMGNPTLHQILDQMSLRNAQELALHYAEKGLEIYYRNHPESPDLPRQALAAAHQIVAGAQEEEHLRLIKQFLQVYECNGYNNENPDYEPENEVLCFLSTAVFSLQPVNNFRLGNNANEDILREWAVATIRDWIDYQFHEQSNALYRCIHQGISIELLKLAEKEG